MHESGLRAEFGIFVLVQNTERDAASSPLIKTLTYMAFGLLAQHWPTSGGTCGPYEQAWAMFSMLCGAGRGWHRSSGLRSISILSVHSALAALTGEACS